MTPAQPLQPIDLTPVAWAVLDDRTRTLLRPLIEAGVLVTRRNTAGGPVVVEFAAGFIVPESETVTRFVRGNRGFLAWREKLSARASLWDFGGRPAELLLSREDTQTAQPFVGESGRRLSELEMAYLDASLRNQGGFRAGIPQVSQVPEQPFTWKPDATRVRASAATGTGEFTRRFQTAPQPASAPPQPAVAAGPPVPAGTGEFTRMFQTAPSLAAPPPAPPPPVAAGVPPTPAPRVPEPPRQPLTPLAPSAARAPRRLWPIVAAIIPLLFVVLLVVYFVESRDRQLVPTTSADEVDVAMKAGDYAKAIAILSREITQGKPVYERRAYAYRLSGNLDAAATDYQHAIASGKTDDRIYADAAYVHALRGEYDQSIGLLTDAIHANPSKSKYYVDRAGALMATKQWKSALGDFENALRLDPTSVAAQNGRADVLRQLKLPVSNNDIPPRVYIQISSEVQRGRARALQNVMTDLGYRVPGIEIVGQKSPARNELRYVHTEDQAQAERLAIDLERADFKVVVVKIPGGTKVEQPRQFELWFAQINAGNPTAKE
jgi:Tfp pilus assembly protein PilF